MTKDGIGEPARAPAAERPADLPGIGVPAESLARGRAGAAGDTDGVVFHQCDDCQALWPEAELREPVESWAETGEGDAAPSGACPACGAPCHAAERIDGVSAEGRAERMRAEMGGAMAERPVVPATSGPCDAPGVERPGAVGVSDPEGRASPARAP